MRTRMLLHLILLALVTVCGGASCPRVPDKTLTPPPPVFASDPDVAQITQVLQQRSAKLRSLQTEDASVSIKGIPTSLRANLVVASPKQIRFRAHTSLTGSEMDLGSNDDLLWFWVKRNDPPAIYYARHDQMHRVAATNLLPVQPSWLLEALGFVNVDPNVRVDGPYRRGQDHFEIRQRIQGPRGVVTKSITVHGRYGWVVENGLYDERNRLLASAQLSDHRYDAASGLSMPHKVNVQLPPAQIAFTLDVDRYLLNSANVDGSGQLFQIPRLQGYSFVDLAPPPSSVPTYQHQQATSGQQNSYQLARDPRQVNVRQWNGQQSYQGSTNSQVQPHARYPQTSFQNTEFRQESAMQQYREYAPRNAAIGRSQQLEIGTNPGANGQQFPVYRR